MNTSMTINVAAIQMVSGNDVDHNMQRAKHLVKNAAQQGAEVVLLPENFAVFNAQALYEWGEKERNQVLSQPLSQWAESLGIWLVAGSLPQRNRYPLENEGVSDKRVRTSSLVFNPQGEQVARYDKIHLFDVDVDDDHGAYRESETIEPGEQPTLVEIASQGGIALKLGLSICYDVRFPELYRLLVGQGAEVLTVPAAFTWETGRAHWEPLLRARAIENQCFIIAANQGGQHTKTRQTWGHSMIIDPWGKVLASLDDGEGVVVATIDLQQQRKLRQQMPVLKHRVVY